jgi:hypothetical protein
MNHSQRWVNFFEKNLMPKRTVSRNLGISRREDTRLTIRRLYLVVEEALQDLSRSFPT